ncbi:hypothetical protein B0H16DRAFT_1754642 [Mycena metata]|uniref:Matrin-type domain-containing protein n=1 Tax=Mycena metata TaxID=1033252 RepID=A0AAD7KKZ8_9AGAR|nr:hypothetical protein B0H16DRAFT_1754642 [Mycena metata]
MCLVVFGSSLPNFLSAKWISRHVYLYSRSTSLLISIQNRVGSKFGGGGVAGASETNDPYILRNHLGSLECRLCLTLHTNEGSYLAHTQGKKHQTNLARRAARDAKDSQLMVAPTQSTVQRKIFLKIGRPGYRVTKVRDNDTGKEGMMVQVHLPQIKPEVLPRRRFMSAYEQKREPPNKAYQYLIVAAEPYETIAFRIPAREIEDETDDAGYWNWSHWDPDTKQYSFQFMFRMTY